MKKNTKSFLIKSKSDFIQQIKERIAIGNNLLSPNITSYDALSIFKDEISKWHDFNKELLKQSYDNPDNEYLTEYKDSHPSRGFLGNHILSEDVKNSKKKIAYLIKGLEKLINKIDLIPAKVGITCN